MPKHFIAIVLINKTTGSIIEIQCRAWRPPVFQISIFIKKTTWNKPNQQVNKQTLTVTLHDNKKLPFSLSPHRPRHPPPPPPKISILLSPDPYERSESSFIFLSPACFSYFENLRDFFIHAPTLWNELPQHVRLPCAFNFKVSKVIVISDCEMRLNMTLRITHIEVRLPHSDSFWLLNIWIELTR